MTSAIAALESLLAARLPALLPREYAPYRPLLVRALLFFVERLSPSQLVEILAVQERLSPRASAERRLIALLRSCPTLHKLGQVIARDPRLSPELRRRLQTLETMAPTTSIECVRRVIEGELGTLAKLPLQLSAQPLAEASVAVVLPFEWTPRDERPREGVLKVLRPGVEDRLGHELSIWAGLGEFLDQQCEDLSLPAIRYGETLETVRRLILHEVRLDGEQRHLREAADLYAGCRGVQVPEVLPFSTPRVTAMERVRGWQITETGDLSRRERQELARTTVNAILARPIWSRKRLALFHADPHAGNLVRTTDGRLALLDWSLAGHLDDSERTRIVQIALGGWTLDPDRIVRAILGVARSIPDPALLGNIVNRAVDELRWDRLPGMRWLMQVLDSAVLGAGVRFGDNLLLFRKTFLTIDHVARDVAGEDTLDGALATSALRELCEEWPRRALAPPGTRDFGTRLSNLDLLGGWVALPRAASRLCLNQWKAVLCPR